MLLNIGKFQLHSIEIKTVTAAVSVSLLGPPKFSEALQRLLMLYLDAAGVVPLVSSLPTSCAVADKKICVDDMLLNIGKFELHSIENKTVTAVVSVSLLGPPKFSEALQRLLMLYLGAAGVAPSSHPWLEAAK
ncbi:hypothetical protein O0L34_g1575 [Tuta absoluta]|nr:hypothetical protein O0L34_g1575 [Tuta absoluta]